MGGSGDLGSPASAGRETDLALAESRKKARPIRKKMAMAPTPRLALPVAWEIRLTTVVPSREAPCRRCPAGRKYSPDLAAGMSLAKWDRDRAWMPP